MAKVAAPRGPLLQRPHSAASPLHFVVAMVMTGGSAELHHPAVVCSLLAFDSLFLKAQQGRGSGPEGGQRQPSKLRAGSKEQCHQHAQRQQHDAEGMCVCWKLLQPMTAWLACKKARARAGARPCSMTNACLMPDDADTRMHSAPLHSFPWRLCMLLEQCCERNLR